MGDPVAGLFENISLSGPNGDLPVCLLLVRPMDSLVELLSRARQADSTAIDLLITSIGPDVRAECEKFDISTGDMSVADLQQEAMIRIVARLHQFHGCDHEQTCQFMFQKWLRTTTRNVVMNIFEHRRAAIRRPRDNARIDSLVVGGGEARSMEVTASSIFSSAEEVERVRAAIATLDDDDRQIIERCFFHDQNLKQAAVGLQITYDQARTRFARALDRLRTRLQ